VFLGLGGVGCCVEKGHYIPQPPGIIDGIYIAIAMILVIAVSLSYITDLPMRLLPPRPLWSSLVLCLLPRVRSPSVAPPRFVLFY
jgi:hypothetical protein